jgi:hypothetical protein
MLSRLLILSLFLQILTTGCRKSIDTRDSEHPAGIKRVWAIDDGEKIKKDDIDNPLAEDYNNAVWKDSTIHLFGAGNEIIAFQLIIQAESGGAKDVDVKVNDLVNGNAVIPGSESGSSDPFDYNGRYIELFTEHYLNVTKRTPPLWFYLPGAAPSNYYTGWLPDCLIPFSAPEGKGGSPFYIPGNSNQGIWVDIYIPRNAGWGTYKGDVEITVSGKEFLILNLSLEVYNFTLPDSTHIRNMFGHLPWDVAKRHGVTYNNTAFFSLDAKYHQMAHRHRMNLAEEVRNLSLMNMFHRKYLTGELYSPGNGYSGPGENIGNNTFSIGYGGSFPDEYGGSVNNMNQSDWWAGSDAWASWFRDNAPGVEIHKYLFPDEPDWKGPAGALGTGSMDTIKMQSEWTHSNPGIGSTIPCLVTNKIKQVLIGYVDFWSVSSEEATTGNTAEQVASERSNGHKYGIYNGYRPGNGAVILDGDAVEFRIMPWIVWKYKIDQYFYWGVDFWQQTDVFSDPLTYDNQVNGDGTFFYPGEDHLYFNQNRGLAGPFASIRAKNWRRGAQDYEYLWLARQAGLDDEIRNIVEACVPTGLWDARNQSNISWSSRGYVFEQYRRQLADLIATKINGR